MQMKINSIIKVNMVINNIKAYLNTKNNLQNLKKYFIDF